MKATDFNLTREMYNTSTKNKGGIFNAPLGVLRNFGYTPETLTDSENDKLFSVYLQSAFDDIDAFNPDRPLPRLLYADLNTETQDVIRDAIILQVNNLMKNGLAEDTQTTTASTGSFTSNTTPNTKIISSDQLSQDVEDELSKIRYVEWKVLKNDNGSYIVYLEEQDLIIPKTKNGIALSSLVLKQLASDDLDIIGEKYAIQLIQQIVSGSREFRGTWDAPSIADVSNIDQIFNSTGLALTDGTTILEPNNTNKGDTILVTVATDASFSPEEVVYDGTIWVPITDNNKENQDITNINNELAKLIFKTSTGTKSIVQMDGSDDDSITPTYKIVNDADQAATARMDTIDQTTAQLAKDINSENVRNNTQQTEIDANTASRIIYDDERSDYLRTGDIAGAITIDLGRLPLTENGNNVEIDTSAIDLQNLTDGIVVSIKLVPKTTSSRLDSIFIRDSYNDASSTQNIILGDTTSQVSIVAALTTITGLNGNNRDTLVQEYDALLMEQLPSNVAGVDLVARQDATTAAAAANDANLNAEKRVYKQLVQNVDFTTIAELKALFVDDDLVSLSLATGMDITGRVTDTGGGGATDPIIIAGNSVINGEFKNGNITIDDQFIVTGGSNLPDVYGWKLWEDPNNWKIIKVNIGKRIKITYDQSENNLFPAGEITGNLCYGGKNYGAGYNELGGYVSSYSPDYGHHISWRAWYQEDYVVGISDERAKIIKIEIWDVI